MSDVQDMPTQSDGSPAVPPSLEQQEAAPIVDGSLQAPTRPSGRPSRATWIVGGAIAGVATLVGLGYATFVLLSADSPDQATIDTTRVADLRHEPTVQWTVDMAVGLDAASVDDLTIVAVGLDKALVIPHFDDEGKGGDTVSFWDDQITWYEGYAADYTAGYDGGVAYQQATYDYIYDDVLGGPVPTPDDYWPFEGSYDDNNFAHGGFYDGFNDGNLNEVEGTHELLEPAESDYSPTAMLVDLSTGHIDWKTDLSDHIDANRRTVYVEAYDVASADFVVLNALVTDNNHNVVLTLDKTTGAVIDSRTYDDTTGSYVAVSEEAVFVLDYDYRVQKGVLRRFDSPMISGTPSWWADSDGEALDVDHGVVFVVGESWLALDASTGRKTPWSSQFDGDTIFSFAGEQLLRFEVSASGDTADMMGVDSNGNDVWDEPIEVADVAQADGAFYVLAAGDSDGSATALMRVDPATGAPMWDEPFDKQVALRGVGYDVGLGVVDGKVIVSSDDGGRSWALDRRSGEMTRTYDTGFTIALGNKLFYAARGGDLRAYSAGSRSPLWVLALSLGEYPRPIGEHLVVIDDDHVTMSGLG